LIRILWYKVKINFRNDDKIFVTINEAQTNIQRTARRLQAALWPPLYYITIIYLNYGSSLH